MWTALFRLFVHYPPKHDTTSSPYIISKANNDTFNTEKSYKYGPNLHLQVDKPTPHLLSNERVGPVNHIDLVYI